MNIHSLLTLIVGVLIFLLGIFVLSKNKNSSVNRSFFLFALALCFWLFFYFNLYLKTSYQDALIWAKLATSVVVFIPITFYQFVINFLNLRKEKKVLILLYLWSILFLVLLFKTNLVIKGVKLYYWGYFGIGGPVLNVYAFVYLALLVRISIALLKESKNPNISINRFNQVKYLLIGFIFALIGGVDFIPTFGREVYTIGYVMTFILFLISGYTIVRHQLMDIELIIKKTLVFTGLLASVFAILVLPTLLIQEYIFRGASASGKLMGLALSGAIIILSLRKIEDFLINVTDKYLFQKKYDYKELLKTFTTEVLTVLELDKLIWLTKDRLMRIMKLESCEFVDSIADVKTEAVLKLPILMNDQTVGVLLLGNKKSDEDYTQEDLDILQPLAKTLGIAISNARLFEELTKTQAEAAQKDKMATIGTLAAGMAHEIRNPITTIRNFADFLPDKYNDIEFINKFERLIPREIDRIESIARSLLEFSSAEDTGGQEEFAIYEPVRTVIAILEPQYRTSEINIVCDPGERYFVRGNKIQLQDAFFNILNYVLAESQKGSRVFIECMKKDGTLSLFVRNKDLIIADHIIKDVFEPVSGLYKEKRGFGFNLFIAKQLIERNNGKLKINSNKTNGSEFRVDFKCTSEQPS